MESIRHIQPVAGKRLILDIPASLQGKRIEIIVQELPGEEPSTMPVRHRKPPAALAGKMTLHDDLIAPAVEETDWEVI